MGVGGDEVETAKVAAFRNSGYSLQHELASLVDPVVKDHTAAIVGGDWQGIGKA